MTQLAAGHLKIQQDTIPELNPSYRLLLGPGPCNVDPRVLRITLAPQLGHLDPEFFAILEDTAHLLRWMFQTKNEMTLCVSGSGFSGAEAVLCNLLEEGDTIISGSLGFLVARLLRFRSVPGPMSLTWRQNWVRPWKRMSSSRHLKIIPRPKYLLPPLRKPPRGSCNHWRSWSASPTRMARLSWWMQSAASVAAP